MFSFVDGNVNGFGADIVSAAVINLRRFDAGAEGAVIMRLVRLRRTIGRAVDADALVEEAVDDDVVGGGTDIDDDDEDEAEEAGTPC